MDFLYGVFSGDQKKVLSYIPDPDSQIQQKEVSDMLSMISYAEERGEKIGIKKGENRLGLLMKILLDDKRYADAKRASLSDCFWNSERLEQDYPKLSKVDIISIVKALEALSSYATL